MASLDNSSDYDNIKSKIKSVKSYNDVKNQYKDARKRAGDSFEDAEKNVKETLNNAKKKVKKFEKDIKNQFEQLLDLLRLVADTKTNAINSAKNAAKGKIDNFGGDSNTIRYVKKTLIRALKNIEPKILELLNQEILSILGCDQQQSYPAGIPIYIKVKSIDLANLLKIDPNDRIGKVLYEKDPISVQTYPFSMNKELYKRITNTPNTFSLDYGGQFYKGASGQNLFDISFSETNGIGETGGYFRVVTFNRLNNANKVVEFVSDYYKTIKLFDFHSVIANIMELLTGVVSINANFGVSFVTDANKFERLLLRILGLCFDNKTEIDVSGISKLAELDGIDDSFFEFNELDLRIIEQNVANVKNGVVEFEECDNVKLPIDSNGIIDALTNLIFVPDSSQEEVANQIPQSMANGPAWNGLSVNGSIDAAIDFNFIKKIIQGLIVSILSPKVLLPIFIMLKSLGNNSSDEINSYLEFVKKFRKFAINFISKIGALFVQELFELLKRDIKNLLQQIIIDVAKEKQDKRIIIILKLIQLVIVVAQFISDWRKCKSVIDEILWLLKIATSGWGGEIPLPLLFGSQLLDGFSESRAFLSAIEEMQRAGIPTGAMPDGSPNLDIISRFSQMKGMANEEAENGKVQIALGPLSITPAGLTVPSSAFGKKL